MNNREKLDAIFDQVETVVMSRQHPVTGLMPASTAVTTHGDYTDAWVRDNVYSIMCIWALGLAYRRQHESERADQLEQTTIKLMRGLLLSMMRQADKVEKFKHTLHPLDALHAKYDTATGLPVVADDAWGHLQIDATSIFLLMMTQMTASGLRIIRTFGEVDFIQNLVYYISSAYRIPDFGIWERGNKINNGKPEINASSVGMAKAALQALDGFNLFGANASKRAVIHTIADAVSLARNTLASLLPRESLSKEVDSALLSIIGYPAFAVGNKGQIEKTRNEILSKLAGEYGCKRFLWDGHQTAIEECSRIYYEHSELASFEHIESEWP
ncbi:MAG TPA: glycoside hydrolase family 15 protein, partial [Marinagarivorans sp.]